MYSKGPGTTPVAVTDQWLTRGITRPQAFPDSEAGVANTAPGNSSAILLFQQQDDLPSTAFIPINLYDAREGQPRDDNTGNCTIAGVMNVVDIDVLQLKNWIASLTGANAVDAVTQNGYGLYFSDRRGMKPNPALARRPLRHKSTGVERCVGRSKNTCKSRYFGAAAAARRGH